MSKLKDSFKSVLRCFTQRVYLVLLLIIIIDLIFSFVFFWKYGLNPKLKEPIKDPVFKLNSELLDIFAGKYEENSEHFQKVPKGIYPDSFNRTFSAPVPEESPTVPDSPNATTTH